jgi:hypothetical protein
MLFLRPNVLLKEDIVLKIGLKFVLDKKIDVLICENVYLYLTQKGRVRRLERYLYIWWQRVGSVCKFL